MTPELTLSLALILLRDYRQSRDIIKAAGDPTDGTVGGALLEDKQLIELLRLDGVALTSKIDELIAKHTPPVTP